MVNPCILEAEIRELKNKILSLQRVLFSFFWHIKKLVWERLKSGWLNTWPHLRAVLIVVHVVGVFVYAMPSVKTIGKKKVWESERSQKSFARWTQRLNGIGFNLEEKSLQSGLWSVAQGYLKTRKRAMKPYRKYIKTFGLHQGWRMFANPKTHPSILIIEIEEEGVFRKIFVTRSETYNWNKKKFDHHGFRKFCGRIPVKPRSKRYNALVKWLTKNLPKDFPEATRFRISIQHWRSPRAFKRRSGDYDKGKIEAERIVALKDHTP